MDIQLTAIGRSELLNLPVIDIESKEEIGHVDQVWLDVKAHKVIGLTCTRKLLWQSGQRQSYFHWTQVEKIGTKAVLVNTKRQVNFNLSELVDSIACNEIFTENYRKVGSAIGYQFDTKTGSVISYLFVFQNYLCLPSGIYQLSPSDVIGIDYTKIIAFETAIRSAQKYGSSVVEKITSAVEFFKEDYIPSTAL